MRHLRPAFAALLFACSASAACSSAKQHAPLIVEDPKDAKDTKSAKGTGTNLGAPDDGASAGCTAPKELCNGKCLDVSADAKNCGSCGFACKTGETCAAATCEGTDGAVTCAPKLTACDGRCYNTTLNNMNCGACGHACESGQTCTDSACVIVCSGAGETRCGDVCCASGDTCTNSACVPPDPPPDTCPTGQKFCTDACYNTQVNDRHCGDCDQPCDTGKTCAAGACVTIGAF